MAGYEGASGGGDRFGAVSDDPTGNSGDGWDGDDTTREGYTTNNPADVISYPPSGSINALVTDVKVIAEGDGAFNNPFPIEFYAVFKDGTQTEVASVGNNSGKVTKTYTFDTPRTLDHFEVTYSDYDSGSDIYFYVYDFAYLEDIEYRARPTL